MEVDDEDVPVDEYLKQCLGKTLTAIEDDEDSVWMLFDGGVAIEIFALEDGGFSFELYEGRMH